MELRILKYFLAVTREKNITKAANVLNITQPTLSRQLMNLEEELNVQLFVRGKNKITLTEDGLLLKRRAQEIIDMSDKIENEFIHKEELVNGEICIGSGETPLMSYLSNIMKQFNDEYPLVRFRLQSANADDIKEKIDAGLLDIGLLNEPVDISKYDYIRIPKKDRWGILMLKNDILSSLPYIKAEDLKNKNIMCSYREEIQNELSSWFKDSFSTVNIIATFNLIYNASLLVENGLGYAITLEGIINIDQNSKLCFKPLYPPLETGCVLVWKKNQFHSSTITKFIERLKKSL